MTNTHKKKQLSLRPISFQMFSVMIMIIMMMMMTMMMIIKKQ